MPKTDEEKLNRKVNSLLAISLCTAIGLGAYAYHIQDTLSDKEELRAFENFMRQSYQISGSWPTNLEIKSKGLLSRHISKTTELTSSFDTSTGVYSIFLNNKLFFSFVSTPTMADLKLIINEKLSHQQKVKGEHGNEQDANKRVHTNIPDLIPNRSKSNYISESELTKRLHQLESDTLTDLQEDTLEANLENSKVKTNITIIDSEVDYDKIKVDTVFAGENTHAYFKATQANLNTFVLINKGDKITIDCTLHVTSLFHIPFLNDCKLLE